MKYSNSKTSLLPNVWRKAFAATILCMGVLPALAQEEADTTATPVAKKTVKKPAKQYPMMEITGRVTDAATGEALAGVQLRSYNNAFYTAMTDENGEFKISVPTFVTSLAAQLQGYNLVRTAINERTSGIEIKLYSDRYNNDYTAVTSASHKVGISDFEETTSMVADDEIHNRLGGDVRSISRSALNAQGAAMFINGLNSLNSNAQPLIILDGVIYDMLYNEDMIHAGYFDDLLSIINMDDIESIEVLKNGTAIYGSKAANGVILINTKRNKSMATRIDFNAQFGVELKPSTMEVMGADEYRGYASQLLSGTNTKLNEFKFLSTDPTYYYYNMYHNNTDWADEVYRTALTQNYSIHIQGGDDVANYNLSVGYTDAASTLKKNDMTRYNIRFNTDIVLNNWFTTRFDAYYTNITRDLRDAGLTSDYGSTPVAATNVLALIKSPFLSPYSFSTNGERSSYLDDADDYLDEVLGSSASVANPSAVLANGEAKNKNHSDMTALSVAITPKWQPTRNFSLSEHFAFSRQSFDESYYTPYVGMPTFTPTGTGTQVENTKQSFYSTLTAIFSDTQANWAIPLGAHRLDLQGGVRFNSDSYNASTVFGYNTGSDKTPNYSSSLLYKKFDGTDTSWKTISYYASLDYNYKEKYYLQGSFAFDASSRFGNDTDAGIKLFGVPWGFFPGIQGAWVISNEDWFKPNNGVNMLKLNVGFESLGNDDIDNMATLTYMQGGMMYGSGTGTNGALPYISLANIGNSKLRWETTNRLTAGLEGNFFNNRLNVKFNYFKSWTSNLVTLGTLAYVAGLEDTWTNDGKLENEGFDLSLNGKVVNARKFKMELGGSIGHYKNELTRLPNGVSEFETDMYDGTILSRVGCAAGVFYGYKTDGVYATSAEAEADGLSIKDASGSKTYFGAGDMKFVDKNGDKVIDTNDRYIIGDPNPDIYGNIYARFFIGDHWTVSASFNYSLGNDIYNYERCLLESGSQFINQTTALNRRWMAEGQVTDIPQATYGDPMGNSRFSDRWIEDGSYLKFKNITVSYTVPLQSQYIQGLTVWAAANNLFTLTRYLGNDPEVSAGNSVLSQGIDAGYLNYGRSFNIGVKLNL